MSTRVPALAALLGLLLLLGGALPVLGHVSLVQSNPAAGATVIAVDAVTLLFDETLKERGSLFKLVGPDGSTLATGTVSGPRRLTLDALELQPGAYTVKWTAAGNDGHIERGRFSFTVEAAVATEVPATPNPFPALGPSDGPAADASEATEAPAATEVPAATASVAPAATTAADTAPASTTSTEVLIPIVAGLMLVGVVAVVVLRRSRTA